MLTCKSGDGTICQTLLRRHSRIRHRPHMLFLRICTGISTNSAHCCKMIKIRFYTTADCKGSGLLLHTRGSERAADFYTPGSAALDFFQRMGYRNMSLFVYLGFMHSWWSD